MIVEPTSHGYPWFSGHHREFEEQILGLAAVLDLAKGATVLDLGSAEGDIAAEFIKRGAVVAHGAEIMVSRVELGRKKWAEFLGTVRLPKGLTLFSCDLEHFNHFYDINRDVLLPRYDIVLCLSIAHKLKRPELLLHTARVLASDIVVVRTPKDAIQDERSGNRRIEIANEIGPKFALVAQPQTCRGEWMGIFRRKR